MPTDLRDALSDAAATPSRNFDVAGAYQAGRRRRRVKAGIGGAAAVLLVVAVASTSLSQLRAPDVSFGRPGQPAGWSSLPDAPLAVRYDHVAAWTGDEMVVWGGRDRNETYFRDGAAYDPRARTWRMLPDAPVDGRVGGVSAWTGEELVVLGGWGARMRDGVAINPDDDAAMTYHRDGAAYDPATDSWRTIAPFPLKPRTAAAVAWTGRELLVWGGYRFNVGPVRFFSDGAAYNPVTDTWRVLPAAPISARAGHSTVWTGTEFVIYGGVASMGRFDGFRDGAAYDPKADVWRPIAEGPATKGDPGMKFNATAWTGTEMLMWTGRTTAGYHPARDRWRPLAEDPLPGFTRLVGPDAVEWTGTQMLTWGGWAEVGDGGPQSDGAAYDPAQDTWTLLEESPLPARDGHSLVWTGSELLIWGGETFSEGILSDLVGDGIVALNDGAAYVPGDHTGPRNGPTEPARTLRDFEMLTAAPTNDESFHGGVVRDERELKALWKRARVWGDPPPLRDGSAALVIVYRDNVVCPIGSDLLGVEVRGTTGVLLLGSRLPRMCGPPPPAGYEKWRMVVVAVPDTDDLAPVRDVTVEHVDPSSVP
jgi:N-acetylneuraminic acid mutarotase